jgi:tetratricopeptide (TPR) repeat protein
MFAHKNVNVILAFFVFLVSSVVYILTCGPTVALWDCGEYLASAGCLGIPHPPGTPLLIPMARVFLEGLWFLKDPGFRLNLLAVFGSAATAMFVYLIIVRVMWYVVGEADVLWKRLTLYCAGVTGGLLCAFSNTFWFCSLEFSEQCNLCLLPVVLTIWLALIWAQSKDPKRDRLLLLIAYIGFSGIGMHMISGITLPAVFLFVVMVDRSKLTDWRLWVIGLCMSTFMFNLSWFIAVSLVATAITFVMMFMQGPNKAKWRFCFWFSFMAVVGFSNHIYMPVRASLNPIIDEDHPVTWKAFAATLDRKQYGSESMVTRSLWRRGKLTNQFGIEGHMGYGGFHITQFFHFSLKDTQKNFMADNPLLGFFKLLIYLLPTAFMLIAWFYFYRKDKNTAVMLILVTLMTTVILTWYMNFADGNRPEHQDYLAWVHAGREGPAPNVHREVRVRDYFWNAGFMFYSMWLGIAAGCFLTYLFTNKNKMLRTTVAPLAVIAFFVSPALPLTQNWGPRDRHMNWIPYDASYNFLMSCDKDGILITNGDNDTFPLWALQEAYGIRKDIRIVNLSLLNTDWYIKQLKDVEPRVPISFTYSQIDALNAELNPFVEPTPYTLSNAGIQVIVPGRKQQQVLRVQDRMVLNIIDSNRWRKPVYFAVTVSDDNFMGLDPYLQMEGLVYRINPTPVPQDKRMNIEKTAYFLDHVYRFGTGKVTDEPVDEAARGLQANYTACYLELALMLRKPLLEQKAELDSLQSQIAAASVKKLPDAEQKKAAFAALRKEYDGKLDLVIAELGKCIGYIPWDWRPRALLQEFLINHGRYVEAEKAAREALTVDPQNPEYMRMLSQALEMQGRSKDAIPALKELIRQDPNYYAGFESLAKNYLELREFDSALAVISSFAESHPGDRRAEQFKQQIMAFTAQQRPNQSAAAPGVATPPPQPKK